MLRVIVLPEKDTWLIPTELNCVVLTAFGTNLSSEADQCVLFIASPLADIGFVTVKSLGSKVMHI